MFLDASAIVSILLVEPDSHELEEQIERHSGAFFFSQISRYESVMAIARAKSTAKRNKPPFSKSEIEAARSAVDDVLKALGAREIGIQGDIGTKALTAAMTYGKGTGHKAGLNMGDCFAYACAKAYRVPLLYKGDDFSQTDLA